MCRKIGLLLGTYKRLCIDVVPCGICGAGVALGAGGVTGAGVAMGAGGVGGVIGAAGGLGTLQGYVRIFKICFQAQYKWQ